MSAFSDVIDPIEGAAKAAVQDGWNAVKAAASIAESISPAAGEFIGGVAKNITPYAEELVTKYGEAYVGALMQQALENPNATIAACMQLVGGHPKDFEKYMFKIALQAAGVALLGQKNQSPQATDAANNTMKKNEAQSQAALVEYAKKNPQFNDQAHAQLQQMQDLLPPEHKAKAQKVQSDLSFSGSGGFNVGGV